MSLLGNEPATMPNLCRELETCASSSTGLATGAGVGAGAMVSTRAGTGAGFSTGVGMSAIFLLFAFDFLDEDSDALRCTGTGWAGRGSTLVPSAKGGVA